MFGVFAFRVGVIVSVVMCWKRMRRSILMPQFWRRRLHSAEIETETESESESCEGEREREREKEKERKRKREREKERKRKSESRRLGV